jgi:pyruvate-formate lyase-activating enzyme
MRFLRKTRAVCMTCLKPVPAKLLLDEEADLVLLEKLCPIDGVAQDVVTQNGAFFAELDTFYMNVMKRMPQRQYFAEIQSTCNLSCNFCYVKDKMPGAMPDLSLADLPEGFVRGKVINLIGGEPTLSPGLLEKIREIRRRGGVPHLSTNGIRCQDAGFVTRLKDAGVDRVFIHFDSMNDTHYQDVCGVPLLQKKMRAIRNLDAAAIPTTLRMVVIRGANDHEIWDLIDFLQRHPSTISIHLMGLSRLGMARENYGEEMMPLDIAQEFCDRSGGLVEMRDILVFLKAFYTWTAIASLKWCLHIYPFLLLPDTKHRYLSYTAIFDRDRLDRGLERLNRRFDKTHRRRNWVPYLWVMAGSLKPFSLLRHGWRHRRLAWTLLSRGLRGVAKDFCLVNFCNICAPEYIDFNVINNCNAGLITKHSAVPLVMENGAHSIYVREKYYASEHGARSGSRASAPGERTRPLDRTCLRAL